MEKLWAPLQRVGIGIVEHRSGGIADGHPVPHPQRCRRNCDLAVLVERMRVTLCDKAWRPMSIYIDVDIRGAGDDDESVFPADRAAPHRMKVLGTFGSSLCGLAAS